ncbi:ABC transporter F family member 3 [Dorcoceras hygrometricum]|uniref:ABC transporter F family member 3 n=1 Tax=Dorcoceras hygrometricum TaxID=472368 RepID=A0A2Z7CL01_9LAMI|nr:ABC transporter F family member 3 [Dorcoceras hygrometricum]
MDQVGTVRGRPSWSNIGQLSWYSEGTPELVQLRTTSWEGNQLGNKLSANQLRRPAGGKKPTQQPAGRDQPKVQQPAQRTEQREEQNLSDQRAKKFELELMRRQFIRVQMDLLCCPHQVSLEDLMKVGLLQTVGEPRRIRITPPGLTRSARTDSPRQVGRNNFPATQGGGGGGGIRAATAAAYERREGAAATC